MRHLETRFSIALALACMTLAAPRMATAQSAPVECTYDRCALNLIPRLTALDVVRGASEERVASLAFLFPRDVRDAFRESSAAQQHASRAFILRRVGAALTDLGAALAVGGLVRLAATNDRHGISIGLAASGAALVGASVPVQFAADAELSRAVREYNRRFAR